MSSVGFVLFCSSSRKSPRPPDLVIWPRTEIVFDEKASSLVLLSESRTIEMTETALRKSQTSEVSRRLLLLSCIAA
jgi:hypothetical protein